MRLLPCSALTTCLLAYTSPPDSPRLLFRRISAPQAIESPTLGTLSNIVQQLVVQQVASEADIQKTVTEALSKASAKYETDAAMLTATAAPRPLQEGIRLPVKPTTITEAKRAFRRAFSGSTLRAPTVKFVNVILDTTCIWKYEYSRVWAVGFTALCDSFLGAVQQGSRLSLSDQMAARTAMCYALGMDADAVAADAAALSRVAATMTAEELLASDDFVQIARVSAFKYTYAFGVGFVLLMKATGIEPTTTSIDRWCAALNLKCARTLERDYLGPVSIDSIGRFSFEKPGEVVAASLEGSIGLVGDF
jgi:Thylakoid formation protein